MTTFSTDYIAQARTNEHVNRRAQYAEAWNYYEGNLPRPLNVTPQRGGAPIDDNVPINLARLVVDVGTAFLFGGDVSFETDNQGGVLERTPAEMYLDATWTANRQATLLQRLGINGGVCGHAFIKLVERPEMLPRLVLLDPGNVEVLYDPDDFEDVYEYRIEWETCDHDGRGIYRLQRIVRAEDGRSWLETNYQASLQQTGRDKYEKSAWVQIGEPLTWPYPFAPVTGMQNIASPNSYWGMADLERDLLNLNRQILEVLSNLKRIVRLAAHPRPYAVGLTGKQTSEIDASPDVMLGLPMGTQIGYLEMSSDLAGALATYNRLRETFFQMARIPEIALGSLENTPDLSGVALQIMYQPLLEKTEAKQRTYGDGLDSLNRRILAVGGFVEESLQPVRIVWPTLLPSDSKAAAETGLIWQQLGVSTETVLDRLGFDATMEEQRKSSEETDAAERALAEMEGGPRGVPPLSQAQDIDEEQT